MKEQICLLMMISFIFRMMASMKMNTVYFTRLMPQIGVLMAPTSTSHPLSLRFKASARKSLIIFAMEASSPPLQQLVALHHSGNGLAGSETECAANSPPLIIIYYYFILRTQKRPFSGPPHLANA